MTRGLIQIVGKKHGILRRFKQSSIPQVIFDSFGALTLALMQVVAQIPPAAPHTKQTKQLDCIK
jgi:hypothetical protein